MHSQRKLVLMLAALLALGAIVAGCGGGDSSTSSSASSTDSASSAESEGGSSDESGADSESDAEDESGSDDSGGAAPTKAAFIKEADEICSKADTAMTKEITDYAKENDIPIEQEEPPSEDQQVEIFHEVVLPNIAGQAEAIAALTPPEGDEETVEDITDTLQSEVEDAEGEDGIPDEDTLEEASKKAKAYGLKTCGS